MLIHDASEDAAAKEKKITFNDFKTTLKRLKMSDYIDEQKIELEIKEKGLNAPRLCPERIDAVIVGEDYYVFPGTSLTVCCLKLKNGFTVIGESASVSLENFDAELGRKIARSHARDKIWALESYVLKERINTQKPI